MPPEPAGIESAYTARAGDFRNDERLVAQRVRLELLHSIAASFARPLKARDIAALIVNEATVAIGAHRGGVWLLGDDAKTLELVHSIGFSDEGVRRNTLLACDARIPIAHCYSTRSEVWLQSRCDAAAFPDAAAEIDDHSELAMACLPLLVDQRCFGACSMAFNGARDFTADERSFLITLSHHAAQALERARLLEEGQRMEGALRFLNAASGVLAGSVDFDATLTALARLAVPSVADWAWIDMLNPDATFRRVAMAHVDPEKVELGWELSRRCRLGLDDPAGPGRVVRTGKPEVLAEVSNGALCPPSGDADARTIIRSLGLASSMCVPLSVGGRPAGAMTLVLGDARRVFGASDLALAQELAKRASVAIDNARAFREAQEANRVKDEFLARMSHELRTPLNAILGWAAMLRARPEMDAKKAIATIERNARAQVRLIEEVLDMSRVMSGKLKLDLKPIDLATVLRALLDVVAASAVAKGITLDAKIAEPCAYVGDSGRLQQVFWNLLSNAIKFTPKGGRVEVSLSRSRSAVSFSVADTGRGIRKDVLPIVFQRFRQGDSSTTRTHGGLGMGLAIVSQIVELHGGTVTAFSVGEGFGATFTIALPVRAVTVDEPRAALASGTAGKLLAGLRVLVCEDDVDSRELLDAVLSAEGATVLVAAAAAEAMEHLREFRPDVLVSDIGLPVVDGYALMRQIRELAPDEGGRVPAIALTAYAGMEDARKAFSAGYQLHVAKPVDPGDLTVRVANLAGRNAAGESDLSGWAAATHGSAR